MTEYQSVFIELTEDFEIKETTLQKIEEFVCVMYGKKKSTTVNDARLDMFLNKYKPKEDQIVNAAKTLHGISMPLCFSVLQEKIKRSDYISKVRMSSSLPHSPALLPLDYGWQLETNGQYTLLWYRGESFPKK